MSSLYELVGERLALQIRLEALDFDAETISDTLDGNSTELSEKIEDYGYVIRNMDSLCGSMMIEIDRMQERLSRHQKRTNEIKAWLLLNMQRTRITKIDCPSFSLSLKTNPPSVIVDDANKIPSKYMHTPALKPPVAAPDKKMIKEAIQSGQDVPGCHIVQTQRVVIE
ncbi:MAG: siphovirus Gp157 family protein [Methylotenera sp.]